MEGSCWECKYLVDWAGENFVQDFKCGWFKEFKKEAPPPLLPKKNIDEGCKYFEKRKRVAKE
jgi:hypothetical protein